MALPKTDRDAQHDVSPLILHRWSPRAFQPVAIPQGDLLSLLEGARWAPSASNGQPWRFVYAHRGSEDFDRLIGTLMPGNAVWAKNASALLYLLSSDVRDTDDGPKPQPTHSFDAGAAWAHLALQAAEMGYSAHAMAGYDNDAARAALGLPDHIHVEVAIAIGRRAEADQLPDHLKAREQPSDRAPVADFAFSGRWPA